MLLAQKDYLPNVGASAYGFSFTGPSGGQKLQKAGNEHWALLPQNGPVTMADVHEAMARAYEWDEEQIERSRRIREGLD